MHFRYIQLVYALPNRWKNNIQQMNSNTDVLQRIIFLFYNNNCTTSTKSQIYFGIQSAFTFSKLTIEALEQGVKYVQS